MANQLHVWLLDRPVGVLTQTQGRLSFAYRNDWLVADGAQPLSQTLPLQSEPFDDAVSRAFFAGLLPEGRNRQLVAQRLQVSRQNDFAILNGIGGECAGAVSLKDTDTHAGRDDNDSVKWLTEQELLAILNELPERPLLAGEDGLRLSLAGAQDKLPVVINGAQLGLPIHETPSTHIIKPPIAGVEGSVYNEGFCLQLAARLSLPVATCDIRHAAEKDYLLVTRYDRRIDISGGHHRIHQEDFCQALGVAPEYKYQNEGGPSLGDCFELLRRVTKPSAPEILRLLDYVIFNTLVGNHDAHGKNFSLLYMAGKPRLAPLYDVLCTAVYPKLTNKMAMKIGNKYKFSELESRHWDQFALHAGLSPAQVRKRLRQMATTLPEEASVLHEAFKSAGKNQPILDEIVSCINQRSALTLRRLTTQHNE